MFLYFKIFKTALMGDIKQYWIHHHFCRRRYRRRHRRSEPKVEGMMKDVKGIVSHGGKR
jgi:hypothetical protein